MKARLAVLLCVSILLLPVCAFAQFDRSGPSVIPDDYSMQRYRASEGDLVTRAGPAAQYALGVRYQIGDRIKLDLAAAMVWYRKVAARGHVDAMLAVGQMYEAGTGVGQDDAEAAIWHRSACRIGIAGGSVQSGADARGRDWCRTGSRASDRLIREGRAPRLRQGRSTTSAVLYAQAQSGAPDLEQAYMWFKLAAAAGNTLAQKNLAALAPSMSAEQLACADQQAAQWQASVQ